MENNLSKKAKLIIGIIFSVLIIAAVIGGSIAIANVVKKSKQKKCQHVYGEGVITTEATCETAGMISYKCSDCDYELTEEIPANGHVELVIEAVPAMCTAKGLTDGIKCATCDKVLVASVETPMLGHKVEALKAVPALCTAAGKTEGAICSRCGQVLKEQTVIPAKGHTVVELKGFAPTCTEIGKTNGSHCSICGKVYSAQEVIPALGHLDENGDGKCDVCNQGEIPTKMVWQLCTDASELKAGDQIIIVCGTGDMALGDMQNSNNRSAANISTNGTEATIGDGVQVIILEEGIVPNTFAFNVGSGYLYAPSSSSNQLKTHAHIDENSSWQITIDSNNVATIVAQGESTKNTLMYNTTSQLFSCYSTTQESVLIYKLVASENQIQED